jgi:serine protease AprX
MSNDYSSSEPNLPEPFDPTILDRSVIAVPLLDKIEAEKELIELVEKKYPEQTRKYNSVVLLADRESTGAEDIRARLQQLVEEATPPKADAEWERNFSKQRIGEILPEYNGVFAWLHARTIQRMTYGQNLARSRRQPVAVEIKGILPSRFQVIIDLNLEFIGGREEARRWVEQAIPVALAELEIDDPGQKAHLEKSRQTHQYVFATLQADAIARLVDLDARPLTRAELVPGAPPPVDPAQELKINLLRQLRERDEVAGKEPAIPEVVRGPKLRAIHRIWPDFEVRTRVTRSISTVKANAAINSFSARGEGIVWAVMDTGIQGDHPHFLQRRNIVDPMSPMHRNFTIDEGGALLDANGHGTHVAGIIAGEWIAPLDKEGRKLTAKAVSRSRNEQGDIQQDTQPIEAISGMAPECKLVSLKVLDENGIGSASNLIAAIAHIQEINGYGRRVLIHGVNISIGYDFDPKWFACGQSPLCVEVDRLVKSGVVAVVAAGNTGYGAVNNGSSNAGLTVTINDPGNADLAITVGSTHRDMPHTYGVSYFSSKGPTGDGRLKPDLVAPGERIISCASAFKLPDQPGPAQASELKREVAGSIACEYIETSGTSMAAPHVSGVIASFLSVRREFIGQPEKVKAIFLTTCTDLRRDRYFQGAGLIDLMRAIQSV